jgi:hypothetical protein
MLEEEVSLVSQIGVFALVSQGILVFVWAKSFWNNWKNVITLELNSHTVLKSAACFLVKILCGVVLTFCNSVF